MTCVITSYEHWTYKRKNLLFIKVHCGEVILADIRKIEETMNDYSSYTKKPNNGRSMSQKVVSLGIFLIVCYSELRLPQTYA